MDITATFQLSPDELRSAIRNARSLRRSRMAFWLVALAGALKFATGEHDGLYLLAGGVCAPLLIELAIRRSAKRSAHLIATPWTVHLTDGTYRLRTPVSEGRVAWSAYAEVTARSGFWYLHQPNRAASFLPQRAFDEAQREQLAAFFAAHLPPCKRPWYKPF